MDWHKIWLVLRREYVYNFRRPSFLFTAFGVPLLSLASMFLVIQVTAERETKLDSFQHVGYVDRARVIDSALATDARYQPVSAPEVDPPVSMDEGSNLGQYYNDLEAAARQQVLDGELDAFFVISEQYVRTGAVSLFAEKNIPQALLDDIEGMLRRQLAAQAQLGGDVTAAVAMRASEPLDVTIRDLDTDDELTEEAIIGRLLLPFIFVFLYFMATNTTAQFLMSGVVEEKENRLMEILATSLRPHELLWGKLFGLGALALTQVVIWASAGLAIASINDTAQNLVAGAKFDPADIALMLFLFLINFLLFSSIMLGIGASVTAESESRQVASFFIIASLLPIMLNVTFLQNPNGTLPVIFTFFPLTAAVSLIMRMGLTTVPAWEMWLSVAVQIISVVVVMWLGAKVFRLGMLMYGKALTPRTVWQALREGRVVLTTARVEDMPAPTPRKRRSLFWR